MAKRAAIITPFQILALDTHEEIINLPEIAGHQPALNSHNLIYSTLIQAGLDEIVVESDFVEYLPVSDSILNRVKTQNSNSWVKTHALIESTFSGLVLTEEQSKSLLKLKLFLSDLLAALADHKSLIIATPMPTIVELQSFLPPELFIPVKSLFSCLQQVEPLIVTPRIDVLRDDVGRFQEVLSSSSFNYYVEQQGEFDNSKADISTASQSISNAAIQLCKKYKRTLTTEKIASILLPISSQTIDTVLGGLPGKVAESACSAAENWLSQNKRLSIYNLNNLTSEIIRTRVIKTVRSGYYDNNNE